MKTPQNKCDIEFLIKNQIQESSKLEYKESRSLSKKDNKITEIAKDVSSMANSEGGIIIYGIGEDNNYPSKITPINSDEFNKEWLEQIITSNISPKIENLEINPIDVESGVVYVIKIPQSFEAHQNTRDFRYYKRRNFKVDPMLEYEIKDVMNRARHPIVELEFKIIEEEHYSKRQPESYLEETKTIEEYNIRNQKNFSLKIRAINKGVVYARYVNYFIELPEKILFEKDYYYLNKIEDEKVEYYGENRIKDHMQFDPILPKMYSRSEEIRLNIKSSNLDDTKIKWKVHADNAPVQEGYVELNKIKIITKQC